VGLYLPMETQSNTAQSMNNERSKIGKANRRKGAEFEKRVRSELEKAGFIVCKWHNKVEDGKIVAAKNMFFGKKPIGLGGGFPDFIAFTKRPFQSGGYWVLFVECKINGQLSLQEKIQMAHMTGTEGLECYVASLVDKKVSYSKITPQKASKDVWTVSKSESISDL